MRIAYIIRLTFMRMMRINIFMTARELIKRLKQAGFELKEGKGHDKMVHPDGRVTVIWRHKGDIPLGTLRAIEKQTKVSLT